VRLLPLLAAGLPPVQLTAAVGQRRILESKANPYPQLPDPFLSGKKKKITKPAQWWKLSRPELFARMPNATTAVRWEVGATANEIEAEIPVARKTLLGHVDNAAYSQIQVDIQLTLVTQANAKAKVPVVMELASTNFPRRDTTWQKLILERGWGYDILAPTSVQPDNGTGLTHGIIGLVNKGQPRAWAWGASRALDYFATDAAVDANRVGLEGRSRYGKAAVVAFLSSSGTRGVKLHPRLYAEQVENAAAPTEYHRMAGHYLQYAGSKTAADLPVFISSGDRGDGRVDAKGMFLAGAGAEPVYQLLGKKGLGTADFPPPETPPTGGEIAFRQHSGGHTPGPNWPTILNFAARYWK